MRLLNDYYQNLYNEHIENDKSKINACIKMLDLLIMQEVVQCADCKDVISDGNYILSNGRIICNNCWENRSTDNVQTN